MKDTFFQEYVLSSNGELYNAGASGSYWKWEPLSPHWELSFCQIKDEKLSLESPSIHVSQALEAKLKNKKSSTSVNT